MRKKPVKAENIELWKDVSALFARRLAHEREELKLWESHKRLTALYRLRKAPVWFDKAVTRRHQGEARLAERGLKKVGKLLRCGAKTRRGTPCQCKPEEGKRRCRFHGGKSTGPRTEAGREAIRESNRRRGIESRTQQEQALQKGEAPKLRQE